jgi:hypothetical protein
LVLFRAERSDYYGDGDYLWLQVSASVTKRWTSSSRAKAFER